MHVCTMNFAASSVDGVSQRNNTADDFSRKVIRLATYNIRSARGGNLESVLRALNQMNVDFCLLCETKLSDDRFTKFSSGYRVFASKAPSSHQGGVALVYRQSPYWQKTPISGRSSSQKKNDLRLEGRCAA